MSRAATQKDLRDAEAVLRPKSILISWIGWENALVKQDVVRVRRNETPEEAVSLFAANSKVAKLIGWRPW
ncbi:MAG: hypothetical protein ACOYB2_10900 [Limnohabitans sp.]